MDRLSLLHDDGTTADDIGAGSEGGDAKMNDDGISLFSVSHPRPPWWRRAWFYLWRPTTHESSITTIEIELPEPATLVAKLRYIGTLKSGDPAPDWLAPNTWGGLYFEPL